MQCHMDSATIFITIVSAIEKCKIVGKMKLLFFLISHNNAKQNNYYFLKSNFLRDGDCSEMKRDDVIRRNNFSLCYNEENFLSVLFNIFFFVGFKVWQGQTLLSMYSEKRSVETTSCISKIIFLKTKPSLANDLKLYRLDIDYLD